MQEELRGPGIDMTVGNPLQTMLKFAGPMLLGNILQQIYNIVDSSVAGRFIGMSALGAVSNGFLIVMIITTFFSALSVGGTVIVAQFLGRQDYEGIRRTVDAIYFGLSVTFLPLMVLGYGLAPLLLRLFNVPPDILPGAIIYVRVIFLGVLGGMGYNVNAGILSGLGDSRSSLKFLSIALAGNLLLDVFFVAVLDMGILGIALATVLAQTFSWWWGLRHIRRHYPYVTIRLFKRGVDFTLVKKALGIGIPSSITGLQFTLSMMLLQSLINGFGSAFIAGVSAADRIDALVFMPINSLAVAVSTFAGQNMGAGRVERVHRGTKAGVAAAVTVSLGLALLVVLAGRPLLSLLFNLEPEALEAAMASMYRVVLPSFVLAISSIIGSSLRGAGSVLVSTFSSLITLWLVRLPLAHWLAANYGRDNLFLAYPLSWLVGLLISGSYYLWGGWESKALVARSSKT